MRKNSESEKIVAVQTSPELSENIIMKIRKAKENHVDKIT